MAEARGIHKLIGDVWATGMDEVDAIASPADIPTFLRQAAAQGRMGPVLFGGESDFQDSTRVIGYATPGGLGLPDKTYYEGEAHTAEREAYQAYVADMLALAGADAAAAAAQAERVLALETRLAAVTYSSEELSRDVSKYYNPVSIEAANAITPAFDWGVWFDANGVARPAQFSLSNPDFFRTLDGLFASVPVEDWKAYVRFHTLDGLAPFLPRAYADRHFAFRGTAQRGQKEQKERWKRVLDTVNGTVGELYVEVAFPAESKAQMETPVGNLSTALKARIEALAWMTPETKAKALEKWASFTPKTGYPDAWRDWSGLATTCESHVGNIMIHGYDDQGSRFDARGSFANWWQPADAEGFKGRTTMLVEQFDAYEALAGKNVNGNLTLGGLTVAHAAMVAAQGEGHLDPMVEGLAQDQRFFGNWATVWRRNYTDKEMNVRLVTDPHAPARFRANGAPSNMPAFAAAFGCQDGDPMVRPADKRIAIWQGMAPAPRRRGRPGPQW